MLKELLLEDMRITLVQANMKQLILINQISGKSSFPNQSECPYKKLELIHLVQTLFLLFLCFFLYQDQAIMRIKVILRKVRL